MAKGPGAPVSSGSMMLDMVEFRLVLEAELGAATAGIANSATPATQTCLVTYATAAPGANCTRATNQATRSVGYDNYGRTQSDVRHNTTNAETYRADYTYLADSMVATEAIAPAAVAGAGTHSYVYDQAGRLTNWTGPAGSVGYSWDKAGNRLTNGATAFVYDARNRQTSAGGVAQTYTPKGDLLTGGLLHDTFGRVTADGNARYLYDGADRPVTRDLANGANTDRHTYLAGSTTMSSDGVARYGNTPGGTAATAWRGGATALLLGADRHGDVVTQHAGSTGDRTSSRAYDPYGAPTATLNAGGTAEVSSWAGNLGYQSDWTDPATNRVNMGARWYTPTTATFTTRDTITLPLSTHVDPNRYTYAAANPMKYIDPNGHCYAAADAGSFGLDVPINCADYPDDPKPAPADISATYEGINEFDSTPIAAATPAATSAVYDGVNEFDTTAVVPGPSRPVVAPRNHVPPVATPVEMALRSFYPGLLVPEDILRSYQVKDDRMTMYPNGARGAVSWLFRIDKKPVTASEARMLNALDIWKLRKLDRLREEAFQVAEASFESIGESRAQDGHMDAFRHTYWNARMAQTFGEEWTEAFATSHEGVPGNPAAREAMDLFNNEVGRSIAVANPGVSRRQTAALVLDAVHDGRTVVVDSSGRSLAYSNEVPFGSHGAADQRQLLPGVIDPDVGRYGS